MIDTFTVIPEGKKLYFASDFHLGISGNESGSDREAKIIRWLDSIKLNAAGIFLVGDIFDFWFEYKYTVPKGHVRFLGKLAEISDEGIPIVLFKGNHDMWMFDYLPSELNLVMYDGTQEFIIEGKKVLVGHGDGLGPGDYSYKLYKKVFNNPFCQKMFEWLHPNIGIAIATFWSKSSRDKTDTNELVNEAEWLVQYCKQTEAKKHFDYYIFGHRHIASKQSIGEKSTYINLGEWLHHCTYAEYYQGEFTLKNFD